MTKEKIRLEELLGIHQVLNFLARNQLPVKTAYWLNRVLKGVNKEFQELEEARKKLIEKHVSRDESGEPKLNAEKTQYEFEPEKRIEFEREFAELGKEEIDIDVYKFSLDQFGDLKIAPAMMPILERFIEDALPEL